MPVLREQLLTCSEVAEHLGTTYKVISGIVDLIGITPKRVRYSRTGKGLDSFDIQVIEKTIDYGRRLVAAAS